MSGLCHVEPGGSPILEQSVSRRELLKGLAALTAAGAVLPLAAACAPAPSAAPTSAPAQPATAAKAGVTAAPAAASAAELKKGGSLKVAILGEPPALDIMFTTATVTPNLGWHMFQTL